MKSIKRRSDCPVSYALDLFGDKWSLLIIRDMMFRNKRTYGELFSSEEKIATNILADRLKMLECAGLIKSAPGGKKRSHYTLTQKAIDLVPVILEIVRWSARYDPQTAAPKEFVERIGTDKEQFARELQAGLTRHHVANDVTE